MEHEQNEDGELEFIQGGDVWAFAPYTGYELNPFDKSVIEPESED